jgi:hypothetical protein
MEDAELALFARGVRHATESASGPELDAALLELGWLEALDAHLQATVAVLFEAQGAAHATSSALDRVFARALELEDGADSGVVLPALRSVEPPGTRRDAQWVVRGVALATLASCEEALVTVAVDPSGCGVLAVPLQELGLRRVTGLDPDLGLIEVTGDLDASRRDPGGPTRWADAVALGQLALGHEMLGAARTMLGLARQHALDRVQFGRAIGTFQAVRHRLADSLVAIEAAAALLDAAWEDPGRCSPGGWGPRCSRPGRCPQRFRSDATRQGDGGGTGR